MRSANDTSVPTVEALKAEHVSEDRIVRACEQRLDELLQRAGIAISKTEDPTVEIIVTNDECDEAGVWCDWDVKVRILEPTYAERTPRVRTRAETWYYELIGFRSPRGKFPTAALDEVLNELTKDLPAN